MSRLPKLPPEQARLSYAEFYDRALPQIPPERYAKFETPMDLRFAVPAAEIERVFEESRQNKEGFAFLPEGGAYIAVNHVWPGITPEMYLWWEKWFYGDDLRYALWYPGKHRRCRVGWLLEDIGRGLEDVYFKMQVSPRVLGFDEKKMRDAGFCAVVGGCGISKPRGAKWDMCPPSVMVVAHFVRETPAGMEILSRFWAGYSSMGDGLFYAAYPGAEVEEKLVRDLARHCVEEFANLGQMLPALYRQEGGK